MEKEGLKQELLFMGLKITFVLAVAAALLLFVFGICRNSDDSMSPALKNGDLIFYYRLQKDFNPRDVVVLEKEGEVQIRRIIAREGDVVDITEEGVRINGYLQQESEVFTQTLPYRDGVAFPITVGKDEYFVLGDQRPNTKDSRIYGMVKKDEMKGVVMTVLRRRGF